MLERVYAHLLSASTEAARTRLDLFGESYSSSPTSDSDGLHEELQHLIRLSADLCFGLSDRRDHEALRLPFALDLLVIK
jgi:hypothetical protein